MFLACGSSSDGGGSHDERFAACGSSSDGGGKRSRGPYMKQIEASGKFWMWVIAISACSQAPFAVGSKVALGLALCEWRLHPSDSKEAHDAAEQLACTEVLAGGGVVQSAHRRLDHAGYAHRRS